MRCSTPVLHIPHSSLSKSNWRAVQTGWELGWASEVRCTRRWVTARVLQYFRFCLFGNGYWMAWTADFANYSSIWMKMGRPSMCQTHENHMSLCFYQICLRCFQSWTGQTQGGGLRESECRCLELPVNGGRKDQFSQKPSFVSCVFKRNLWSCKYGE